MKNTYRMILFVALAIVLPASMEAKTKTTVGGKPMVKNSFSPVQNPFSPVKHPFSPVEHNLGQIIKNLKFAQLDARCRPVYEQTLAKYNSMGHPNAAELAFNDLSPECKDWFALSGIIK